MRLNLYMAILDLHLYQKLETWGFQTKTLDTVGPQWFNSNSLWANLTFPRLHLTHNTPHWNRMCKFLLQYCGVWDRSIVKAVILVCCAVITSTGFYKWAFLIWPQLTSSCWGEWHYRCRIKINVWESVSVPLIEIKIGIGCKSNNGRTVRDALIYNNDS